MAQKYGCDKNTILKYAKEIGYKNQLTATLDENQKKEIISQYNIKTSVELAKEYNVSRGQITKLWYDNDLIGKDKHTYPFDYKYFERIDSDDKAYFLGFLAADGNVFQRENKKSQAIIRLSLQKNDRTILEMFKFYINSDKPLHISTRQCSYISYIYSLELVSSKMALDLEKYNIKPNKTYDYEIVDLGKKYMSHFFRGYFDGDGCITCKNNAFHTPSQYNISIAGFEHNLLQMQNYLSEKENIQSVIILDNREEKHNKFNMPFGNLVFTNINEKYKFLEYIYQNKQDIYLPRKRYLAECFINAIKKNYANKQNLYNDILMPSQMKPTCKSKIISEKENWKAEKLIRLEGYM